VKMKEQENMERTRQTAYELDRADAGVGSSANELIYAAMYRYLREDLGLPEPVARDRAAAELAGNTGKNVCDECERAGISIEGKRVLDLGAGLGGVSAEVARRGGKVIAIEPGAGWRTVAAHRLGERGSVLGAVGEHLPIASDSIDLIVSLQVLEHVQNPKQVIKEAFRILKRGGYFFLSYENYLSFWEPHYRVRWFPLLPKPLGSAYLKALGRNPQFLNEAITYTTFPKMRHAFFDAGFECMRLEAFKDNLRADNKPGAKWKLMKAIESVHEQLPLQAFTANDYLHRMFTTGIWELMRKPMHYTFEAQRETA